MDEGTDATDAADVASFVYRAEESFKIAED
jgi:hypothetical protein